MSDRNIIGRLHAPQFVYPGRCPGRRQQQDQERQADAQTLAAASNHSAFNIANAIGAWLGGLVIAWGYGFAATGYVGAALSFLGLFVFAASLRLERRDRSTQAV